MKVLFISSGNATTGISPIIKSQGESLKKEKIDLDYFSIDGKGIKGYLKSVKVLRKILKNTTYDIIHAHYGFSGIVSYFAKRKEKLIVSFMGDDLVGSYDSNGKITLKSKAIVFLNKFLAKYYYYYNIVKSKQMLGILNLPHSEVIPNGVDFDSFYEIYDKKKLLALRPDENLKQILFCSNPSRVEKNFNLAKDAVNKLDQKNLQLSCLQGIEQKELVNYYNAADCVLLTSFHEGSPNVIKEAMACNIPIVSTDVGDVKEIIKNTEGCYIANFDAEDVASKIMRTLEFNKRTTGRKDIQHLESSIVAKRIIDIYNKVLKE